MSGDVEQTKANKRGCLLVLAGLVTTLVIVPVLSLLIWTSQAARQARIQIDEIAADGLPVDGAGLDKFYVIEGEATDLTSAWLPPLRDLESNYPTGGADLPIVGEGDDIPPVGQPWTQREEARDWLAQARRPLSQLHEAAGREGSVRYPVNLTAGIVALLPHAAQVRSAARALALEAEVHAHDGDAAATIDSIRTGLALGQTLEREPVMISQLVRFAVDGTMFAQVERHLGPLKFDDDQLRELQEQLQATDYEGTAWRTLVGERAMSIQAIQNPGKALTPRQAQFVAFLPRGEDTQLMLQFYGQVLAVADQPYHQAKPVVDRIDRQFKQRVASPLGRFRYTLSAMLIPAFDAFFQAQARTQASRRAATAAVAVKRFQQRNGRLPAKLDDLVPDYLAEVPIDPFDGKPLRYRTEGAGFVVYSVGANQTDEGGQPNAPLQPLADVTIRVQPKAPQPAEQEE